MKTFQKEHQIICRLEVGDEILTELKYLAATFPTQLGTIKGIGACDVVVVALSGNVDYGFGTIVVHLLASFARLDTSVFGGHLERAAISRTGELIVSLIPVSIGRVTHTATKLQVLDI